MLLLFKFPIITSVSVLLLSIHLTHHAQPVSQQAAVTTPRYRSLVLAVIHEVECRTDGLATFQGSQFSCIARFTTVSRDIENNHNYIQILLKNAKKNDFLDICHGKVVFPFCHT